MTIIHLKSDKLTQRIQMQLSKKEKTLSDLFSKSLKSRLIVKHFKKKGNLIVYVLAKLQTPKNMVKQTSKKLPTW